MAFTAITVTPIDRAGTARTDTLGVAADGVNGNAIANAGKAYLWINNGDAAPHTLTIQFNATAAMVDGQTAPNRTLVMPAGSTFVVGPFDPAKYNDTLGNVNFTYSAATSVKVAAFSQGAI
jgi:hypothetical protein